MLASGALSEGVQEVDECLVVGVALVGRPWISEDAEIESLTAGDADSYGWRLEPRCSVEDLDVGDLISWDGNRFKQLLWVMRSFF